jgi:hypothetical protein
MSGIIAGTITLGGDADTPQPSNVVPHALATVGADNADGLPVEQGYRGFTLQYTELDQDEYDLLLGLYDAQQATRTPTSIAVYDPDTGATTLGTVVMGRPRIRSFALLYRGVTVELTRYTPLSGTGALALPGLTLSGAGNYT